MGPTKLRYQRCKIRTVLILWNTGILSWLQIFFLFRRISEDRHLFEFDDVVDWTTSLKQQCIHISVNVSTRSAYTLWPRPKKGNNFQITFQTHFVKCKWKILLYMDSILTKDVPNSPVANVCDLFRSWLGFENATGNYMDQLWASYNICKNGMRMRQEYREDFPCHRRLAIPTFGGGEYVPGITGACTTRNLRIW